MSNEETKHFDEIFATHHSADKRGYMYLKKKKDKKRKEKGEDLGLDMSEKL